jgi:hypothetical protein
VLKLVLINKLLLLGTILEKLEYMLKLAQLNASLENIITLTFVQNAQIYSHIVANARMQPVQCVCQDIS